MSNTELECNNNDLGTTLYISEKSIYEKELEQKDVVEGFAYLKEILDDCFVA
jgi:hypothetical protein